ncbi:hypothetical protein Dip510_000045 [Elusimicrobium posterum]|uniref:hypothetical protein n=1 Tax=Elusimicrobium posterum TaxID=3116653 RepID=UPI003C74F718
MNNTDISEIIEPIIINSLKKLPEVYNHTTSLIFPKHRNVKRVSEQEARFLFLFELQKNLSEVNLCYSIETPTEKSYSFKTEPPQIIDDNRQNPGGVDVCLHHKETKKVCSLIEFKAHSCGPVRIGKDFLKLFFDKPDLQNYLVHTLKNVDSKTFINVEKKYSEALNYIKRYDGKYPKSSLKIFLYNINDGKEGSGGKIYEVKDDYTLAEIGKF